MTDTDRLMQLQMLATSIVLLHKRMQINLFGQSSKTALIAVQFLAMRKWLQCPQTRCTDRTSNKTLLGRRNFGGGIRKLLETAQR